MIGERILQARRLAGLSSRALAEQVGVSAMAISKYERDENTPGSEVLLRLAKALDVRTEYFFRPTSVSLEGVEFRKRKALSSAEEKKIIADVSDKLERWAGLDEIFPPSQEMAFAVPDAVPAAISGLDDIEDVALAVRDAWSLGHNPIPDLVDTLEEHGIRVIVTPFIGDKHFDGLAAHVGAMPVIAVGAAWPGDRQRFTLAHELGHLLMRGRLGGDVDEEKACDRFAGAFLAPRDVVLAALGQRRNWIEPRELSLLKAEFGLSIAGWTYRARDLGILNKTTHGKYWGFLRKRGWDKQEPGNAYPSEHSRLFEIRVYRALAEDWVGESRAAELLGIPVAELRACRNMECSTDVADQ
ncbi:MAG TPA: helix-turn-helix domain-containing protein [Gammaproteobacteria bacterium]|nr:helix-turn-helix domain-containing protein [Gammaproteobacteria bacterium]